MSLVVGHLDLAHFKEDNSSGGYNYSTGMELVLTGLGSTSSPLEDKIEKKYQDILQNLDNEKNFSSYSCFSYRNCFC